MSHKILIVEDNALNKKLFEDILHVDGYTTFSTDNGIEAKELALLHEVSLVLMDIQLPEISGLDTITMFRNDSELKDIPIIAVTAFAMKGDEEHILSRGASAYLSKPIAVSELLSQVRKFLRPDNNALLSSRGGAHR